MIMMFVGGVAIGFVLAWAFTVKTIWDLEDELEDTDRMLDTAVKMLREERKMKRREETCEDCGDLSERY